MEHAQHLNAFAQAYVAQLTERLVTDGFTDEELESNQKVIIEFIPIAVQLMGQNGGIQVPGSEDLPIEFDEQTGEQLLTLFAEGIYYTLIKCYEMKLTVDLTVPVQGTSGSEPVEMPIKNIILQNLAMDIYGHASQIVASTYGQENTPEFQFTIEQQIDMIQQTSNSATIYYINEFEKQNGSIDNLRNPEENEMFDDFPDAQDSENAKAIDFETPAEAVTTENTPPQPHSQQAQAPMPPATSNEKAVPSEEVAAPIQPVPVNKPVVSKGPSQHDKYAAVSLLLLKIKDPERQKKVLASFKGEERELISYYLNPQHIMQNLDITCVQSHLKHFGNLVRSGKPGLKSDALTSVEKIMGDIPEDELLMWATSERPRIKQFVLHYLPVDESVLRAFGINPEQENYFSENLPPRLEAVLHQFLMKKFNVSDAVSSNVGGQA